MATIIAILTPPVLSKIKKTARKGEYMSEKAEVID